MNIINFLTKVHFKIHLIFSLFIRIVLIYYGNYHDEISQVKYTDIDYKVFTDASRHVLNGTSPYNRHTYRYSPLVAICLIPNLLIDPNFGKFLFCLTDILVAVIIRSIVKNTVEEFDSYNEKTAKKVQKSKKKYFKNKKNYNIANCGNNEQNRVNYICNIAMISWLYNPMTIAIGTRGNCDSIAGFLVLSTLYFLQCRKWYFVSGLVHGISIHFRLYPLIYSLTYFMFLSKFSTYTTEDRRIIKRLHKYKAIENTKDIKNSENTSLQKIHFSLVKVKDREKKTIFKKEYLLYLVPNSDQIKLITGCLLSLSFLTWIFYHFYGYTFLYETYIYHLVRKDTRHNFSIYFYLQYLTAWVKNIGLWQKVLMVLPQLVLLLVFSCRYGLNKYSLNFSILTQTIVMVIYNSVLTSQYFVWIMAVLPLCLWQIKIPKKTAWMLLVVWFAAQGAWLLPAYLLEFHGQNTFIFIWVQGVSFFCANIAILGRFIMYFVPMNDSKQKIV